MRAMGDRARGGDGPARHGGHLANSADSMHHESSVDLDDFNGGYQNLGQLATLPASEIRA